MLFDYKPTKEPGLKLSSCVLRTIGAVHYCVHSPAVLSLLYLVRCSLAVGLSLFLSRSLYAFTSVVCHVRLIYNYFMAALCNRAGHIYFHPVVSSSFFLSFFFSSPNLGGRGDWMSTILPHMVWP